MHPCRQFPGHFCGAHALVFALFLPVACLLLGIPGGGGGGGRNHHLGWVPSGLRGKRHAQPRNDKGCDVCLQFFGFTCRGLVFGAVDHKVMVTKGAVHELCAKDLLRGGPLCEWYHTASL